MRRNRLGASLLLAGTALAAGHVAFGQTTERVVKTARFVSSLEANDNYGLDAESEGNSLIWRNTAGFGLTSRTRVNTFALDAEGTYRLTDEPNQDESEFDDPRLRLSFARNVDDTELFANVFFRRVEVDDFDPLSSIDDDGNFDDVTGEGTRQEVIARFGGTINEDGPLSFTFGGSSRNVIYEDTDDPDLEDYIDNRINGEVGFRLNPTLQATLGASYQQRDTDSEDESDRTIATVDTGFNYRIGPATQIRARIGYSDVEGGKNERSGKDESGVVGSFNVERDMRNGSASLGYSSRLDENGSWDELTVGRSLEFANGDTLSGTLGVSARDYSDPQPIASIAYSRERPQSRLDLGLRSRTTTDRDSEDVLNTSANVGYSYTLSKLTAVSFDLSGAQTDYLDSDRESRKRVTFVTSVNRALSRDWGMAVGYRYRMRDLKDDEGTAESNAVFLNVSRNFSSTR